MKRFRGKVPRVVGDWHDQFAESAKLEKVIKPKLRGMGYGG